MRVTADGGHDSLVCAAASGLDEQAATGTARAIRAYVDRHKMLALLPSGIRTAPVHRKPVAEQLDAQAERLESLGDPSASLWRAHAESVRLAEQVAALDWG